MNASVNLFFAFLSCFLTFKSVGQKPVLGREAKGKASFYANKFNGKRTYYGETFSNLEYTAAHKYLPYNTVLAVSNPKNGKFVYVRVTDRGPYGHGRLIDLTHKAATHLGITKLGIAPVTVKVVGFKGFKMLEAQDPEGLEADSLNNLLPPWTLPK
jgi:rare lipoprotein A